MRCDRNRRARNDGTRNPQRRDKRSIRENDTSTSSSRTWSKQHPNTGSWHRSRASRYRRTGLTPTADATTVMTAEEIETLVRKTLGRPVHDHGELCDVQRQLIDLLEKRLDREKTICDAQERTIASLEAIARTHEETIREMSRILNREAR
jgi:hypothetical protein